MRVFDNYSLVISHLLPSFYLFLSISSTSTIASSSLFLFPIHSATLIYISWMEGHFLFLHCFFLYLLLMIPISLH
jgi:hypothetical protein